LCASLDLCGWNGTVGFCVSSLNNLIDECGGLTVDEPLRHKTVAFPLPLVFSSSYCCKSETNKKGNKKRNNAVRWYSQRRTKYKAHFPLPPAAALYPSLVTFAHQFPFDYFSPNVMNRCIILPWPALTTCALAYSLLELLFIVVCTSSLCFAETATPLLGGNTWLYYR
jgi:hypothetical protein